MNESGSQPSCYVQDPPISKLTQFTSRYYSWYEDSLLFHWVICCQGLGNRGPWKDSQNIICITPASHRYTFLLPYLALLVSISVSHRVFQPFSSNLRQIIVMHLVYGWHKIQQHLYCSHELVISLFLWRCITQGKLICTTNPTSQNVTGSPVHKIKQTLLSK